MLIQASFVLVSFLNIALAVDLVPEDDVVKFSINKDFVLQCNIRNGGGTEPDIKWQKDNEELHTIDALKNRVTYSKNPSNATITITHATEDDAGNYTCALQGASATILAATSISVNTPENVNVVEGEKLRIVCTAHGRPAPQIHWTVGESNYTSSLGHITLQPDPEKNITNAVLLIDNVNVTHKGAYKCIGYSPITKEMVADEAMVRVKDKYAALWPFLGICLEVFVLCAIILIYEKKRNKSELEESDTDQSPDQKNTPDHGKDTNLRHRQ